MKKHSIRRASASLARKSPTQKRCRLSKVDKGRLKFFAAIDEWPNPEQAAAAAGMVPIECKLPRKLGRIIKADAKRNGVTPSQQFSLVVTRGMELAIAD